MISPSGREKRSRWKCNKSNVNGLVRETVDLQKSRDAATIARLLSTVRTVAEAALNAPITSIAPAIFPLRPNELESFQEALKIAGLKSTRSRHGAQEVVFVDVKAAFAGLDAGMCNNWQNRDDCISETMAMQRQSVLFLNLDNSSFSAGVFSISNPYQKSIAARHLHLIKLGWWNLPVFEVPRARFWAEVQDAIAEVVHVMSRPPSRIILMGEHGADEEFKIVAEAALWQVLEVDVEIMLQAENVGKITVRGAAELAWRSNYWDVEQSDHKTVAGSEASNFW